MQGVDGFLLVLFFSHSLNVSPHKCVMQLILTQFSFYLFDISRKMQTVY